MKASQGPIGIALYRKPLFFERVRKMLNKYIAIGYYGLPVSTDPYSITYDHIGGVYDLDRMDEHIPVPGS